MVVYKPYSGLTPEAIAKAIPSGIATIPTVIPAIKSRFKLSVDRFLKRLSLNNLSDLCYYKNFNVQCVNLFMIKVLDFTLKFLNVLKRKKPHEKIPTLI